MGSGQFSPLGRHHLTVDFPRTFKVNKEVRWHRGRAFRTIGKHQNTELEGKKNSGGRGVENAPGLRTAAPSSADRGLAEAEAPVPDAVRSRRSNVSDTPLPGTSVSQAPHVPDTPRVGHPSPGTPGSSAEGTGGGRAEGHLPTRARGTTG